MSELTSLCTARRVLRVNSLEGHGGHCTDLHLLLQAVHIAMNAAHDNISQVTLFVGKVVPGFSCQVIFTFQDKYRLKLKYFSLLVWVASTGPDHWYTLTWKRKWTTSCFIRWPHMHGPSVHTNAKVPRQDIQSTWPYELPYELPGWPPPPALVDTEGWCSVLSFPLCQHSNTTSLSRVIITLTAVKSHIFAD